MVRYFTAKVSARPNDPDQPNRQQTYFRALETVPEIEIHLGHFLTHQVTMPDAAAWQQGRYLPSNVIKTEEKGSDVNLATWLLMDAFDNHFDCAVIVSNDSDLKEPINQVRTVSARPSAFESAGDVSQALRPLAHFIKPIRVGAIANAQFPNVLTDAVGQFQKPGRW